MSYSVVITTCASQEDAESLASKIIENKLAACVQLSNIQSYYVWNDAASNELEVKLSIKTRHDLYGKLEAFIRKNHSYQVPEIIELPIQSGSKAYLDWIDEVTEVNA
ncbi:MAG: divalent-cation tolerance protein CutA [Chlorobiales bacterium]|jgi:periplasmic divalent cation tolerance protein|nr:divalent-cation tolerance protein CutA [Chlorobiales bacterium]